MNSAVAYRGLVIVAVLCVFGLTASSASATEYRRNNELSLTGTCGFDSKDPIEDPGCPYPPPPDGPSARFEEPRSVAIDAYGDEYIASFAETGTGRIDVFDDEGQFITELSDPYGPKSVAVDTEGYLYVWERGNGPLPEVARYSPTIYEPETGKIEYSPGSRIVLPVGETPTNGGVAVDLATDRLYVAERNSIQVFKPATDPDSNGLIETITAPQITWTNWIAIDHQRDRIYASHCNDAQFECGVLVLELGGSHAVLEELSSCGSDKFLSSQGWISVVADEQTGNFFAADLGNQRSIYQFNEGYECIGKLTESSFQGGNAFQIGFANTPLAPNAVNSRFLFVPLISAGNVFAFEPVEIASPDVSGASAGDVGETEAELSATVNPEGADTTYRLEYELVGSGSLQVVKEGTIPAQAQPLRVSGIATGLLPGSSYRFIAVASNEAGSDEEEETFTTFPASSVGSACPNQSLRVGPSAILPDCRAYELVTPPDTNGHAPEGIGLAGDRFSTVQASPQGDRVSFIVKGGVLPGLEGTGSFDGDPYLATRGASGWMTTAAGPNGTESNSIHPGGTSPDQQYSFWQAGEKGTAIVEPGENHYVRYPDGSSQLVGTGPSAIAPTAKGVLITENGSHIVFETVNNTGNPARPLTEDAPPQGTTAVYDRTPDGVTHLVSFLPGNITPGLKQNATYVGASPDGTGIAFEIGQTLYLRVNDAVTYEIGEDVEFAGVSEGGRRIFYVSGGDLLAFDTQSRQTITFAGTGDATAVNVATGGGRAYFLSESVIPDSGKNGQGASAQAAQPNLYVSEEGSISFVATVNAADVASEVVPGTTLVVGLGAWTDALPKREPSRESSRLNPAGTVLLFRSRAVLSGQETGGVPQIYRYDSAANSLHCISCVPTTGGPPGEGATFQSATYSLASAIPFSPYAFVPGISPDGRRAFFESTERLLASDTDGVRDVYEWEEEGTGNCERPGGCVYLISSGRSGKDNFLYGQSASGDDVFFTTGDVLVGSDTGGTLSIYDARVDGGFPEPPQSSCSGEACKPVLTSPPSLTTPAKAEGGSDNLTRRVHCRRGRHKARRHGKVRCVKHKHHRRHRHKAGGKGAAK